MRIIKKFNEFKRNRINEDHKDLEYRDALPLSDDDDNFDEYEEPFQDDMPSDIEDEDENEFDNEFSDLEDRSGIDKDEMDRFSIDEIGDEDDLEKDVSDEDNIADRQEIESMGDEEQEGDEYIGSKLMNQLGEMLDAPVVNNKITYAGKSINFYSETEKFHVDNREFETPDEVYEYLMEGEPSSNEIDDKSELEEPVVESRKRVTKRRRK